MASGTASKNALPNFLAQQSECHYRLIQSETKRWKQHARLGFSNDSLNIYLPVRKLCYQVSWWRHRNALIVAYLG